MVTYPWGCLVRVPSRAEMQALTFAAQDASVKHLGVPLSRQPDIAATALYTAILEKVEAKIARWSGFRLSLLGRAYVAKQLLAYMVTYPWGCMVRVPSRAEMRALTFAAQDASVKHLGVPLSRQPDIAATALYTAILEKVEAKIARWSGFRLS